jgi:hypothetical protein
MEIPIQYKTEILGNLEASRYLFDRIKPTIEVYGVNVETLLNMLSEFAVAYNRFLVSVADSSSEITNLRLSRIAE